MDYLHELTIPANTTEAAPVALEVDLGVGVLVRCEVGFPLGPVGLCRARVRQGLTPRFPTNDGAWYHWDKHIYETPAHLVLRKSDAPYFIEGWSEDDSFPYIITFRFIVLPVAIAEAHLRQEASLRKLITLFTPKRLRGES